MYTLSHLMAHTNKYYVSNDIHLNTTLECHPPNQSLASMAASLWCCLRSTQYVDWQAPRLLRDTFLPEIRTAHNNENAVMQWCLAASLSSSLFGAVYITAISTNVGRDDKNDKGNVSRLAQVEHSGV